jgi:hypothetical protein
MSKIIRGFKGFDKDLKCRGFQFKVGKEYEEPEAVICEKGFHFCENPLDVLNYYDLCDSEFAEVESSGKTDKHSGDSKIATTKMKINAKLSLDGFIKASVDFLLSVAKKSNKTAASGDYSKLAASGDSSKLAASGYYSQLAASGYSSQLAASGDSSKLAASGDSSKLAASGYYSQLAASGYSSQLAASGYSSQLAASGDSSKLAASGDSSKLAASGDSSKLAASGYSSQLAASGDYSQLAASGYSSQLAASGDFSRLEINGEYSVGAAIGRGSIIKGKKGNWITLAEWAWDNKKNYYIPVCVKSAQIDGEKIKADTFYQLKNGKFVEAK